MAANRTTLIAHVYLFFQLFLMLLGTQHCSAQAAESVDRVRESRLTSASRKSLKIGVLLPLTGPSARIGYGLMIGMSFAQHQRRADQQPLFELAFEDDGCDAQRAVEGFTKLSNDSSIDVILGPACEQSARALLEAVQLGRRPLVILLNGLSLARESEQLYAIGYDQQREAIQIGEFVVTLNKTAETVVLGRPSGERSQRLPMLQRAAAESVVTAREITLPREQGALQERIRSLVTEQQVLLLRSEVVSPRLVRTLRDAGGREPTLVLESGISSGKVSGTEFGVSRVVAARPLFDTTNERWRTLQAFVKNQYRETGMPLYLPALGHDAVEYIAAAMKGVVDVHEALRQPVRAPQILRYREIDEFGVRVMVAELFERENRGLRQVSGITVR